MLKSISVEAEAQVVHCKVARSQRNAHNRSSLILCGGSVVEKNA